MISDLLFFGKLNINLNLLWFLQNEQLRYKQWKWNRFIKQRILNWSYRSWKVCNESFNIWSKKKNKSLSIILRLFPFYRSLNVSIFYQNKNVSILIEVNWKWLGFINFHFFFRRGIVSINHFLYILFCNLQLMTAAILARLTTPARFNAMLLKLNLLACVCNACIWRIWKIFNILLLLFYQFFICSFSNFIIVYLTLGHK